MKLYNKMLHIITKKPNHYFSIEYLKFIARKILKKKRGPQAVVASLTRGFNEINFPYKLNTKLEKTDTLYVNESLAALRWAIKLKRAGKITRLIAGPNLVVAPDEFNSLIGAPEIDLYLVPGEWVRNWLLSINPNLEKRLVIWAAGVKDTAEISDGKNKSVLIYKKTAPAEVLNWTEEIIKQKGLKYQKINYGAFQQTEYFSLLLKSSVLIYLQVSESQGIALTEAWARNVPTLVWNNNDFKYKNYFWQAEKLAAPYLSAESGAFFKNEFELSQLLDKIAKGEIKFSPRDYYLNNFTDRICAQKFLDIIKFIK